jgi:uncharacterized protein
MIGVVLLLLACFAYVHAATWVVLRRRSLDADNPPNRFGLTYEDVAFPTADGLTLCGWFIPAGGPMARGTIIFCHGQSGSMDRDADQAPFLHTAGFNVLMFDFRGHGRSEGEWVTMGYLERLDLGGALDYLSGRGVERVGVLGWSMGGAVAVAVAREDPRVVAVVSDSGYASFRRVLVGGLRGRGLPAILAQVLSWFMWRYASLWVGVDLAAQEPQRVVNSDFRCPLLLIQGDADRYVPLRDAEMLAAATGGSVELWRLPGVPHRLARERFPAEYRRRVTEFFAKRL